LFEITKEDQLARIGKLNTPHGIIKTPIVFPVHNLGAEAGWNTPRYWEIFPHTNTAMFNAYYILRNRRNIREKINDSGGIHKLLGFNGVTFLDSGGFIRLKQTICATQSEILQVQEECQADIASTLDFPFLIKSNNMGSAENIVKNIENAKEAAKARKQDGMLLFASVHGDDPQIMHNVLRHLNKYSIFDGFAIGSMVPIRARIRLLVDLVLAARMAIHKKPLHIYGLGGILSTPLLTYLGADSFDSTSFIICGGKRQYFVPNHTYVSMKRIAEIGEIPCTCPVCSKNTIEEIRESRSLISLHNLWILWYEMRQLHYAIAEERLEGYIRERYARAPIALQAFEYARHRINRTM
jgi:tRNA-guanine family transglycosylase